MSGCADVCLDMDSDSDSSDFWSESMVKARKPHTCAECGDIITAGALYERASGKSDGEMWSFARLGLAFFVQDVMASPSNTRSGA